MVEYPSSKMLGKNAYWISAYIYIMKLSWGWNPHLSSFIYKSILCYTQPQNTITQNVSQFCTQNEISCCGVFHLQIKSLFKKFQIQMLNLQLKVSNFIRSFQRWLLTIKSICISWLGKRGTKTKFRFFFPLKKHILFY